METKLNDRDILHNGDFNSNHVFFIQRWAELLNIHTHSRYAVRYLNSHIALKEMLYVCKGMINEEIKRTDAHLKLVFEEVNQIIEADELLIRHAENHAKIMKNSLRQPPKATATARINSIIYQLEYVIRHLNEKYLVWIVQDLQELLQQNEQSRLSFNKIERLANALASELLGKGWSLKGLHSLVSKTVFIREKPINERFEDFFSLVLDKSNPYIYLFAVKSQLNQEIKEKLSQFKIELLSGQQVIDTYSDFNLNRNIATKKDYIRMIGSAFDLQTGVNEAWQKVTESFDVLKFYNFDLPKLEVAPIILSFEEMEYFRNIDVSLVVKKEGFRAPDSIMDQISRQLNNGENEINRKIRSLFEFSRISEESFSPQSAFLNLWIAIESFVETDEFDGGIENVKMFVSSCSTHNYLYSLLRNFLEDCNRCNLHLKLDGQIIKIGRKSPREAINILLSDDYEQIIEEQCNELNKLLAYRYKELKDILKDGRKSSRLLNNHKENIKQHLQRLYRLRNSIVHSGESYYNTSLFIKHLKEYLESVMSVVLHRLEDSPNAKLEETFAMVRDSVEATIETLNNSKDLDENVYFDLVLRGAF